MANKSSDPAQSSAAVRRSTTFEELLKCAPVCESLLLQLPTDAILALYHTCRSLRQFLRDYPTSWKYLSYRLHQPTSPPTPAQTSPARPSSNYALDQLLIYVVNPFSTCLTSLELDNTAVSGLVLYQTVLALRRETLEHLSVRGCKNVSLKYHINPWLNMFCLVNDLEGGLHAPPEYRNLALKSLYTYRCRHHRRRPYLPSSLQRKDSDSEPTHELVNLCHKLGIWTDTAWCTTPGGRCFRRRGYSTMRGPQDHREVWVVFDRLWRCRNWLGPIDATNTTPRSLNRKRKRDPRKWEVEEAVRGEPLGAGPEGKGIPAHLRKSHTDFVENIICDNCGCTVLERCEQCSVTMHCSGCRKTLCASCAFDRPYLRNLKAPEEERGNIWWAPGCAVSPCSMQDQDPAPSVPGVNPPAQNTSSGFPNLKFKWCCTEPVFSGGGGITFSPGSHSTEAIRAAPIVRGMGWEDTEFTAQSLRSSSVENGLGGRWASIDALFRRDDLLNEEHSSWAVPRNLCAECYAADQWKVRCKACMTPICLKHDLRDRLRARLCGFKDLPLEKTDFRARQRAQQKAAKGKEPAEGLKRFRIEAYSVPESGRAMGGVSPPTPKTPSNPPISPVPTTPSRPIVWLGTETGSSSVLPASSSNLTALRSAASDDEIAGRPHSPESNSTAAPSRSSSPSPSVSSSTDSVPDQPAAGKLNSTKDLPPNWKGCQSFLCPPTRVPGDHRRRCTAVMRQCLECKINICGDCIATMEPACPCTGCRQLPREGTPTSISDTVRFFCPNCRWKRRQTGSCKRRVPEINVAKKKKGRRHKPFKERVSGNNPSQTALYEDGTVEMAGEFFEQLELGQSSGAESSSAPGNPENDDIISVDEGQGEDLQELEDMGSMARDLISRIQRLRAQIRPGAAAMLATRMLAGPEMRLHAVQDHDRDEQNDNDLDNAGEGPSQASLAVDGMD